MSPLALLLVAAGVIAIAIGALRIRGPLATIRRLDQTAANLERYDSWRGRSTDVAADGPTGADEMRAFMRRRVVLWGVLIGAGAVLIIVAVIVA